MKKIGVLGTGTMGAGIIQVLAQNGYEVTPIYNPRGLYTNYWANRPNNGINWDPLYNMVVFRKPGA